VAPPTSPAGLAAANGSGPSAAWTAGSGTNSPTDGAGASASAASGQTASLAPSPQPSHDPVIPPTTLTGYQWPLAAPIITLPFGPTDWGDFFYQGVRIHDGVDMASWCGDTVMAAHDGTVIATGTQFDSKIGWVESLQPYTDLFNRKHWWNSLPLTVVIDDGNGFRSIYAHEYQITVKVGQKVKAGQKIGYEGATGNASGCHVHFGLFSPNETAWFSLDPGIVSRDLLPEHEIARVNPLYVLPFRCEFEEMRALFPQEAAPCPPLPTPTPK
jgi:murein DD-endopeptidase MepM/ murein hydrolase activator NlpD